MVGKSVKIIIIAIIILIILISVVGVVLFFTTDLLKTNDVLFKKYLANDVQNIAEVLDISHEEEFIDYLIKRDYTSSSEISLKYLENQNDEEEEYIITEEGTSKGSDKKAYSKINATYDDEKLMNLELLRQDNLYGFRLANIVQQFVSVENASLAYFISSIGYKGQYFSEKLNLDNLEISGLLKFSEEEINTLINIYSNSVFSDIDKKNYSSKRNVMITLNNGESVTTSSYSLTLTKNELDKIYRKILNQAIDDEIILNKIKEIDNKIKEAGFNEPQGESLEEIYKAKLEGIREKLEYEGADNRQIIFTVYNYKGNTVRTSMKTEDYEYQLDLSLIDGKNLSLKSIKNTAEGVDTKTYIIGRNLENNQYTRSIQYIDDFQSLKMNFNSEIENEGYIINGKLNYSSNQIHGINVNLNTNIKNAPNASVDKEFKNKTNIILNNYENRVDGILNSLKTRTIQSLEESYQKINTKLLNNILIWIDAREKKIEEENKNNIELQKERFNNQFILYEGEDLKYEHIQKLLKAISGNILDYEVISGTKIKISIQQNSENEVRLNEISEAISDKHTYNVHINYSETGYVDSIEISVFEKK